MSKGYYIGVMSGTSLDGIDVALCEIDTLSCRCIAFICEPFAPELKEAIGQLIEGTNPLALVGELDQRLGVVFAEAIERVLVCSGVASQEIEAVGLHGQTVWHAPEGAYPFSMQLGDPSQITARLSLPVVADFRRKDIALGGEGAPFAPAFHHFCFAHPTEHIGLVNIGGMANLTLLTPDTLLGYDTGCGNILLDYWITRQCHLPYDHEGAWARSGVVERELLSRMLADPYFAKPYPKSTGREYFNAHWLEGYLATAVYRAEDIQRTLLELSAVSITQELLRFGVDRVLLCGGGAYNSLLVERIEALMGGVSVERVADGDRLEAMLFAWLAYKRIHHEPIGLKRVTGATEDTILGGVYV